MDDNFMSMSIKLAEGNPGALTVLLKLFESTATIDPQAAFQGLAHILYLDELGIYGSRIWMLYKDVCKENIVYTMALLRAVQMGVLTQKKLDIAIDNYGDGIDCEEFLAKVQKELTEFNITPTKE